MDELVERDANISAGVQDELEPGQLQNPTSLGNSSESEQGVGLVVFPYRYLVTPVTDPAKGQIWASPIQLSIALKNSPFYEAVMDGPYINKGKGTLIIPTKKPLTCGLEQLHLGSWKITCKLLQSSTMCYGVIGPIDINENIEEIKTMLIDDGYPVVAVTRLFKRASGQLITTQCIKISFSIKDLPSRVRIGSIPFLVREFIPMARQCFNCQHFGHIASSCRSKTRCLFCGANHLLKDCPKISKKCANCGGEHLANYGGCHLYKRAQEVEKMAWESRTSYSVILSKLSKEKTVQTMPLMTNSDTVVAPIDSLDLPGPSYASVVNGSPPRQAAGLSGTNFKENNSANSNRLNSSTRVSEEVSILEKLTGLVDSMQTMMQSLDGMMKTLCAALNYSMTRPNTLINNDLEVSSIPSVTVANLNTPNSQTKSKVNKLTKNKQKPSQIPSAVCKLPAVQAEKQTKKRKSSDPTLTTSSNPTKAKKPANSSIS